MARQSLGQAICHFVVDAPGRTAVAESIVADATRLELLSHRCCCH